MPTAELPPDVQRAPPVIPADADAVPLIVAYDGVGHLHQGFFNTEELVQAVAKGLGGCVGGTAEVVVKWNQETRIGSIVLHTLGDQLTCRPTRNGAGFDLTPMVPVAKTLAGYRDGVANGFDLRIGSFRTGIRVIKGSQVCEIWTGGQFPPDGTTFSPCVHLQGHEVCTGPDRHAGLTELVPQDDDVRKQLARCF